MREKDDMATTDKTAPKTPAKKPATPRRKAPAKAKSADTTAAATAPAPARSKPVRKAPRRAAPLRDEAGKVINTLKSSAKEAANSGKAKTTDAIDDVTAMVEDVARTIDTRVGPQYGDYARRAADALAGVSDSLKSKDVEQLLDDARDFIRRKPAVAIGAAAAIGFVLTRLLKADEDDAA